MQARREGLLSSWWLLEDGDARARVRRSGRRVVEGGGSEGVDRPLAVPSWASEACAGQEQLGVLDLDEGERSGWWTRVHLGRGHRVLGAIEPTGARVGLAWTVAVCGLVARRRALGVVSWRRAWTRRGERVDRVAVRAVDVRLRRSGTGTEEGLEGHLLSVLGDDLLPLHTLLRQLDPRDGHAWLAARCGSPASGVDRALLAWIDEEPEVTAVLVQRALVGVGLLADR